MKYYLHCPHCHQIIQPPMTKEEEKQFLKSLVERKVGVAKMEAAIIELEKIITRMTQ